MQVRYLHVLHCSLPLYENQTFRRYLRYKKHIEGKVPQWKDTPSANCPLKSEVCVAPWRVRNSCKYLKCHVYSCHRFPHSMLKQIFLLELECSKWFRFNYKKMWLNQNHLKIFILDCWPFSHFSPTSVWNIIFKTFWWSTFIATWHVLEFNSV